MARRSIWMGKRAIPWSETAPTKCCCTRLAAELSPRNAARISRSFPLLRIWSIPYTLGISAGLRPKSSGSFLGWPCRFQFWRARTYGWCAQRPLLHRGCAARLCPPFSRWRILSSRCSLTIEGIYEYGTQNAPPVVIAERAVGPYRIQVTCAVPCNPREGMQLAAKFLGEGFPNYKRVSIGESGGESISMKGTAFAPTATLTTEPHTPLQVQITRWDETTYKAVFPAPTAIPGPPVASASLPDTPAGVWGVIAIFSTLTIGVIVSWFCFLWRAQ